MYLFALIAIIAGVLIAMYQPTTKKASTKTSTLPPSAAQYNTTESMLSSMAQMAQSSFGNDGYTVTLNQWAAENTYIGETETAAGFPFKILSGAEPTLYIDQSGGADPSVAPSQPATTIYNDVALTLKQHGFIDQGTVPDTPGTVDTNTTIERFEDDGITCSVTTTATPADASYIADSVFLSCISPQIASYTAFKTQSFATLTARGLTTPLSQITMGPVSIKDQPTPAGEVIPIGESQTPGYQLAESLFKIGNSRVWVGLYYEKDNIWHYITKATDEWGFPCAPILNNPDARKAMYNQVCYSKSQDGQISVDTDRDPLP